MSDEEIARLGSTVASYVGVEQRIPGVRVLCFGSKTDRKDIPEALRARLDSVSSRGAWLSASRTAVIFCGGRVHERLIILHELTHALLDTLTDGFRYPLVIQEGYARAMECVIPAWTRSNPDRPKRTQTDRFVATSDVLGIHELLMAQWTAESAGKLTNLAFWLNVYLSKFPPRGHIVQYMLRDLWKRDIKSPSDVYAWILAACGVSRDAAEQGFRQFCLTGRHFASD